MSKKHVNSLVKVIIYVDENIDKFHIIEKCSIILIVDMFDLDIMT